MSNPIGVEIGETAHVGNETVGASVSKAKKMMVNVKINTSSNIGVVQRSVTLDSNSKYMNITVGDGINDSSFSFPHPIPNNQLDLTFDPNLNISPSLLWPTHASCSSYSSSTPSPSSHPPSDPLRPSLDPCSLSVSSTPPSPLLHHPVLTTPSLAALPPSPSLSPSCSSSTSSSVPDSFAPTPVPSDPVPSSLPPCDDLQPIPLIIELPSLPLMDPIPVESQPILVVDLAQEESSIEAGTSSNSSLELANSQSIWADHNISKEEKIWALAKKIGVSRSENDQSYIGMIKEMEARDKEASRKMVNPNGSE